MRFSIFSTGFAVAAAAVALEACGGHGVVPSQSFAPVNGLSSDVVVATKTPSPCEATGKYYFHGSCKAFTLSVNANTTVELGKYGAYHGIKITTTFSPSTGGPKTGGIAAVMGDAVGGGDITGLVGGKKFPEYGVGNDCVNPEGKAIRCPGKKFVYAELINNSQYRLKPKSTPKFVISDTNGFPGKNLCFPAILTPKGPGTVGGWSPDTALGSQPHGTNLVINSQPNPGNLYFLAHTAFIVAGVCE